MPALDSVAAELYAGFQPLAYAERDTDYALAQFCAAIGAMPQPLADIVRDSPDGPGWSSVMDVDRCPGYGLGWLAQLAGVTLPSGLDDTAQRDRIRSTDGMKRGSLGALIGAAQQHLTGAKTVIVRERDPVACPSEPAYGITVITYTSQTPDSAQTLADILLQKPAGLVLNYAVHDGQDYESLYVNHPDYDDVHTTYATYEGVVTDQPGV
jgi:hypothetical protein